ncbi:MAG: SIS domain-containing protein [Spirochaetaceae bacterium]
MNEVDDRYAGYALCREMLETPQVVQSLDVERIRAVSPPGERVVLTGEGSSRIFPGRRAVHAALQQGERRCIRTESAHEAAGYRFTDETVFVASNSGKTAECVRLIRRLRKQGFGGRVIGVAGAGDTPVAGESDEAYVLTCGPEAAVAATKSVVEQALVYDLYLRLHAGRSLPDLPRLAEDIETALTFSIPAEIAETVAAAPVLYFAGANNGVAEELTLKANEIVRGRSDFLPGTYAVHGVEEVMDAQDVLIWIDPPREYEEKFSTVLSQGVGLSVIALSSRQTSFETLRVPTPPESELAPYVELAAGWNLLVEAGIQAGLDLDKPERARKVGNEYVGD